MTHVLEIGAENRYQISGTRFVTRLTCRIFLVPIFWYGFTAPISGRYVMGIRLSRSFAAIEELVHCERYRYVCRATVCRNVLQRWVEL